MRFALTLAAIVAMAPSLALADAGHTHGKKGQQHYDGHAMALGEPGDPKARGIRTIEVVMTDEMRFKPAQLNISKGQTVKFVVKNTGLQKHEFVLGEPDELVKHAAEMEKYPEMEHDDPNSIQVEPGKIGELVWRFTKAGTWDIGFGCLLPGHFSNGMKGKIVVR